MNLAFCCLKLNLIVDLFEECAIEFLNFAVIGDEAVDFTFYVRELSVDGGGETFWYIGDDTLVEELFVGSLKESLGWIHVVAEECFGIHVSFGWF